MLPISVIEKLMEMFRAKKYKEMYQAEFTRYQKLFATTGNPYAKSEMASMSIKADYWARRLEDMINEKEFFSVRDHDYKEYIDTCCK